MRITRRGRRGTVLPMLALCLTGLFGFVALAVDLGMLAVSRTECQNAADVAALVGCRQLNNKPTSTNSNLVSAVSTAKAAVTGNKHLSEYLTAAQISKIETGQYLYNPASETFTVATWTDVTNTQTAAPPGGSWTAVRVTLAVSQPTYFMKVFGIQSMPSGAAATAVYRPRDVAFVLDMTGSMAYASQFNFNGNSMNPDNLVPSFGHYVSAGSGTLRATANQANTSFEAISRNNYTISTPGGPPIVRNFYYDPATPAGAVTVANLRNAFHNIPANKETAGNEATYTPPTYDFTSYNAFDSTRTNGPTPAPTWFGTMTDSGTVAYVGDRWRRADGAIRKTSSDTSWSTGGGATSTTRAAATAVELLGYNVNSGWVRGGPSGTTNIATEDAFRDPIWEANGYDLNIVQYRTDKGNGNPRHPSSYTAPLLTSADQYKGFSMGPGYWGKTFYVWPPDPRFDTSANLTSPDNARPAFDTSGRAMCDWRRRFFVRVTAANLSRSRTTTNGTSFSSWSSDTLTVTASGTAFDPQGDNLSFGSGTEGVNQVLMNSSSGMSLGTTTSSFTRTNYTTNTTTGVTTSTTSSNVSNTFQAYRPNYAAVLKWIKTGPQTLPPNLRAGRVLYYSSIPNDVDTSTGTAKEKLDKVFWKNYIDYVMGCGNFTSSSNLYGNSDSWSSGASRSIYQSPLTAWTGPTGGWTSAKPYMRYNDSPGRPRLHFWFGPLSMLDFMGSVGNMMPGTCNEAQCWQLKAGMNSVLDDVRNNHPNDYVGLVMFAGNHHNGIRVPMGQDYTALKNALFYPKSLLTAIKGGDTTSEVRPFTTNGSYTTFSAASGDEIPNSNGSTDPNTGLAYAFNLLSPSSLLPSNYTTTVGGQPVRGRRGAAKTVIMETDGVPNTYRGLSNTTQTMDPTTKGYDTFYPASTWSSGNVGNGDSDSMSEAVKVAGQIVKPMATQGNAQGSTADSGMSLPNAPAKVYAVGFGDLFDTSLAPNATFRTTAKQFLADVSVAGKTLPGVPDVPTHPTSIPDHQIITGTYQQRIDRLKDCMQRIFQAGVAVTLVE